MKKTLTAITLTLLTCNISLAQTPEEKGLAIAIKADKRDTGWGDSSTEMFMTLRNSGPGMQTPDAHQSLGVEVKGDGDKSLTIFDEPRDVKGTAFLSFTHAKRPDDQWFYLPALKRVKRISSANSAFDNDGQAVTRSAGRCIITFCGSCS